MNTVIADPAGSAWTFGGSRPIFGGSRVTFGASMLTFAFPMLLFIVVARTATRGEQEPEGGE
ncbi:MAG TPA: hypothetical protein VHS30_16515 [Streptosporangiaceae bacterium]|nr:hypothetical protein [Streptosporangiaceae bacterium]